MTSLALPQSRVALGFVSVGGIDTPVLINFEWMRALAALADAASAIEGAGVTTTYSTFFSPTVLGTAASVLVTVPTSPTTTLLRGGRMRLTNTTGGAVTVTVYAVPYVAPYGGVPADGNAFLKAKSIAANDYLDVDVPIMGPGATLQALASAGSSITAHMLAGSYYS